MFNCTEFDTLLRLTHGAVADNPIGIAISIVSLLFVGTILLAYGERIIRPAGAVIGGLATLVISYVTLEYTSQLHCEVRVIIACVLAVLAALAISCILRSGVFLVGAVGLGSVTHIVYDAIPTTITRSNTSLEFMNRSAYYYIAMTIALVGGGILSYTQRKKLMRIMSSAVGGGCIVLAVHLVWIQMFDNGIPATVALVLLLLSTVCGAFLQHFLKHRKDRQRQRGRGRDTVPVGIPVT
tara:strand:- start:1517 stop:2233 length:717 start_codon:yes stop_codon:yes gene_type:complete